MPALQKPPKPIMSRYPRPTRTFFRWSMLIYRQPGTCGLIDRFRNWYMMLERKE
jgi:hypothetical protein